MPSHDTMEGLLSYATAGYAMLSQVSWMQVAGVVLLVLRLVNELLRLRQSIKEKRDE